MASTMSSSLVASTTAIGNLLGLQWLKPLPTRALSCSEYCVFDFQTIGRFSEGRRDFVVGENECEIEKEFLWSTLPVALLRKITFLRAKMVLFSEELR